MKLITTCLCVLYLLVPLVQADASASGRMAALELQETFLREHDLGSFTAQAVSAGWVPPVFFSKWHVDKIATPDEKELKNRARAYGSLLATELSREATIESLDAKQLLDLADWLNRVQGYGNILLGIRCLDLAAVKVAQGLIESQPGDEDLSALLLRLRPAWLDPEPRQRILNAEAGYTIFFDEDVDKVVLSEKLARKWATGQTQRMEGENPRLKAVRLKYQEHAKAQRESHTGDDLEVAASQFDRPEIVTNLPFFKDDHIPVPARTADTWEHKMHGKVAQGVALASVEKVEALAEFRDKVGSFPSNFNVKHPFYTGGKAAFDLAWQPHATRENRLLYVTAWTAYDELKRGVFLDQETGLVRALRTEPLGQ